LLQHCESSTHIAPFGLHVSPASTTPREQTPAKQRPEQQLCAVAHIAPVGKQLVALLHTPPMQLSPQHCEFVTQELPSGRQAGSHVPAKQ
jgi:hypothetical protein